MNATRGTGRTFLRDAAHDIGSDLAVFLVAAALVAVGGVVGYLVADGQGAIVGAGAGFGVFVMVVLWWAVVWAVEAGRGGRDRLRR